MDEKKVRELVDSLDEGVYFVDTQKHITLWNKGAERITGYKRSEVLGSRCSDNILRHVTVDGIELCIQGCPLSAVLGDGNPRELEAYLHHKNGHRVPVYIRAVSLEDEDGKIVGSIELFADRSDRSALLTELEQLRQEVLRDKLTGLGNRKFLDIVAASRFKAMHSLNIPFGLLMLDIDHFKRVNDTYGHQMGDSILQMIAGTIASSIRPLDNAIRFGGEEFVVLCPNLKAEELAKIAERLRVLAQHAWLDSGSKGKIGVTLSLGGALVRKEDTLESILARADSRLYKCKETGRNKSLVGD